jgi:hypothetical protein
MKTTLKARPTVVVFMISLWLVSSLACGMFYTNPSPSAANPPQPVESSTAQAAPMQRSSATEQAATATATPSPTMTAMPTRLSQPVVAASYCNLQDCSQYTYPGDFLNGVYGGAEGVMLVLPGQIWTASDFVGIQQWDPQTGKLVKTIPNTVENDFSDIKYDGQQLWDYAIVQSASGDADATGVLYVVNPVQGELVKKIDIPNDKKTDISNNSAMGFPNIGVSPGEIWVKDRLIDTQTFDPILFPWNFVFSDPHFAYDGQGQMWIQAEPCPDCSYSIWIYDARDPTKPLGKGGTAGLTSNPDLTTHHNLIFAGGKMWATAEYQKKPGQNEDDYWELLAYDIQNSAKPVIKTDISTEMKGRYGGEILAADNHVIWLAPNDNNGKVYYYDQTNGLLLGSLHVGALIYNMQFDGQSLWVMDNEHGLEKIALPWAP